MNTDIDKASDDLIKRLRIKAGMIMMGERIQWGSDAALMNEAASRIEAMTARATPSPAPIQQAQQEGLSDTDRMDLVAKSGVRGSTYKGITSINVIVHEDDLLCGGARYAIDCMIERAPTVKASQ